MKNDLFENRMGLSNTRGHIPPSKLQSGSVTGKYPVILDGGKTIVYISDLTLEAETRNRYTSKRR
jgi:hypothetical protein